MKRKIRLTDRVHLYACENYSEDTVRSALLPILEGVLEDNGYGSDWTGKNVVIKPNLLAKRKPQAGITTHPIFVQIAASYFVSRGADVTIADSPGGPYQPYALRKIYETTGMQDAAEKSGAKLNFSTETKKCGDFTVIRSLAEADLIVNLARLKTHMLCDMTAAVKNMFGSIAGLAKTEFHAKYPEKSDFCGMLVDLCAANAPQINITDMICGMEGNGPSGGTLRKVGAIAGSANPFALDLLCSYIMGYAPTEVQTVDIAVKRGLCPPQAAKLVIKGEAPTRFATQFRRPKSGTGTGLLHLLPASIAGRIKKERRPYVREKKCIGCGECARACPAETIVIRNKKAVIHRENCIKCFCCQELCPQKAVDVR